MRKSELVILFSVIFMLFSSCEKQSNFSTIEILGHAGNGLEISNSLYHDNSFESIELALLTDGCDGVELDVRMSADHTLWLFHDTQLESETKGEGCVESSTDEYLSSLHYTTIDKESLIRLSDIPIAYLKNKKVYIDSRTTESCTNTTVNLNAFLDALITFRNACDPATEIIVEARSSDWESLLAANGFTTIKYVTDFEQYANIVTESPTIDIIVASNDVVTSQNVEMIHADGREVIIFGMRSARGTRQAYLKKPDGILADNLRTAIIEKY
jgi:glycerophosphoryl diester phosphodiesterase